MAYKMRIRESRNFYKEMFDEEVSQGFEDIGAHYRNAAAALADGVYLSNGNLFFFSNGRAYKASEL
ncbi:MAG: hypothetical protein HZB85_09980 [Deltaproteobacteria bacterium]|nr:hypothetical protein [Deltaproteobacteria bacterium]